MLLTVDQICELDVLGARQTKPACEMWVRLAIVWDGAKTRLGQADLGREIHTFFTCLANADVRFSTQILSVQMRPSVWIVMTVSQSHSPAYASSSSQLESCAVRAGSCVPAVSSTIWHWSLRKFGCQCIVRKSAFWHFNCVQMLVRCVKNFSNSPL